MLAFIASTVKKSDISDIAQGYAYSISGRRGLTGASNGYAECLVVGSLFLNCVLAKGGVSATCYRIIVDYLLEESYPSCLPCSNLPYKEPLSPSK